VEKHGTADPSDIQGRKHPRFVSRNIKLEKPSIRIANTIKSMVLVPFILAAMSGEKRLVIHI